MPSVVEVKKKSLPRALLLLPAGASLLAGCSGTPSGNDGGICGGDPECIVLQGPDGGPLLLPDGGYDCECAV